MAGVIRSLVNARGLQMECIRVLHETLLIHILTYSSETTLWKEKERSRVRAEDSLRGLLCIRRMGIVPNARIKELSGVMKGVNEKIEEGAVRWFGHVERMEKDRIAKWVGRGRDELIP